MDPAPARRRRAGSSRPFAAMGRDRSSTVFKRGKNGRGSGTGGGRQPRSRTATPARGVVLIAWIIGPTRHRGRRRDLDLSSTLHQGEGGRVCAPRVVWIWMGYGNDSRQTGQFVLTSDSTQPCEAMARSRRKASRVNIPLAHSAADRKWGSQSGGKPDLSSPSPRPGQRPERRRKRRTNRPCERSQGVCRSPLREPLRSRSYGEGEPAGGGIVKNP
jgi:hypothetical protein